MELFTRFEKATAEELHKGTILGGPVLPKGLEAPFEHAWGYLDKPGEMEYHKHYKEEIYFLDGTGCMAKGWVGFTKDTKVKTVDKYVKNTYANITLIEGFGNAFEVDATDALAVALTHFYETGKPKLPKGPKSWEQFIAQNPDKIVKR